MKITVEYMAQLRDAMGCSQQSVELADGTALAGLIASVASGGGRGRELLLDAQALPRASVLAFVDGRLRRAGDPTALSEGATVVLSTPVSGG